MRALAGIGRIVLVSLILIAALGWFYSKAGTAPANEQEVSNPSTESQFIVIVPENKPQLEAVPQPQKYVIDVSAATLWKEPGIARAMDAPVMAKPTGNSEWVQRMSIKDKLWLVGKTETQALYGEEVQLIESRGEWSKVTVVGQSTPKHVEGYPGWLPTEQLMLVPYSYLAPHGLYAMVRTKTSWLMGLQEEEPFLEISFNTRLPVIRADDMWVMVNTPSHGSKRIRRDEVTFLDASMEQSNPTGEQLVQTGQMFLRLPYLWAGVSGFGFDCSGFTYSLYKHYGILIPRDAADQAKEGIAVDRSELRPGDLVFFARNKGKGPVHHVAMYAGNGRMIHSPRTERTVEIIPLSTVEYDQEYAGARRYISN
jgi:gamma-D-glutamyl-L-lysine dipeptidyl-peptidase